jgi:alanyl aminopeptidase
MNFMLAGAPTARRVVGCIAVIATFAPLACGGGGAQPVASPQALPSAAALPTTTVPDEPVPTVRLPDDVRPQAQAIELAIDPNEDHFRGTTVIDVTLDHPRRLVWIHGRSLTVDAASYTPDGGSAIPVAWDQMGDHGVVKLTLATEAPAGHGKLRFSFGAPFNTRDGLYRITEGKSSYAYTQFEPIAARDAFPCFDEPGFKIPFSVTLVAPKEMTAVANTAEEGTPVPDADGKSLRHRYSTTKPLPSYLVAFAVGPFDVVTAPDVPPNAARKRPLPIRGIAPKGRAADFAYAMAHAGAILATLEGYFGIEYPYDKLDIIAAPDKGGAMENAGAVVFDEYLVLMNAKTASLNQKRSFAQVVAHELAHQWFGDLVTMKWWDDLWLNESFAEWMGNKASDMWDPKSQGQEAMLAGTQSAIGKDGFVSARKIRQPIDSTDDIENAFDDITYQKGGSVIGMFERWLGPDVFQKGVRLHLSQHAFGSATADDFLSALSTAAQRDVKTPFHTFLDQPGVPLIEAALKCDAGATPSLHLTQSRFLPLGSKGDANRTWQVPVCTRYEVAGASHESCTLLTSKDGDFPLTDAKSCPAWVFPNANASGYYRFTLAPKDLATLRTSGIGKLSAREKIAFGNSLRAGFHHGSTSFHDTLLAAAPLASESNAEVASEPNGFIELARDWLYADTARRPTIDAYARKLYARPYARLGWTAAKTDDNDTIDLRKMVVSAVTVAGDPAARKDAKKRALAYIGYGNGGSLHREAIDEDLVWQAMYVAGHDADMPLFDALVTQFAKTEDEALRGGFLWSACSAVDPAVSAKALDLALDPRLRPGEAMTPIYAQLASPETRDAAWTWVKAHWDALFARVSTIEFGGLRLLGIVGSFCDEAHAADIEAFFKDRIRTLDGGPRELASGLEGIRLCVASRAASEANAREFFAPRGPSAAR